MVQLSLGTSAAAYIGSVSIYGGERMIHSVRYLNGGVPVFWRNVN